MWSLRVWKNAWPGSRIVPVPMLFCQSNYWALWTDGALSDRETALRVGFFASLRMTGVLDATGCTMPGDPDAGVKEAIERAPGAW